MMNTDYNLQFVVNGDGDLRFISYEKLDSLICGDDYKGAVIRVEANKLLSISCQGRAEEQEMSLEYAEQHDILCMIGECFPELHEWSKERLAAFIWGEDNIEIYLALPM
jgi:hypothetical protein